VTSEQEATDAFVGRLFDASLGAMEIMTIYLGDRLGLYRSLAPGDRTASELASDAAIDSRYAREWLEQQAAAGILTVDASVPMDERRFSLPSAYAEALVDPESPAAMAALGRSVVALGLALPHLVEAFRSGAGVPWQAYGDDMIEAQGDFNRPWLVGSFATEYLPSIPDVHDRLSRGATVADVACGVGWAAISIARAYPAAVVHGFDLDEGSIDRARSNADEAGLGDRVTFDVRDAADPSLASTYDLAVVVEAIHDMARPVEALAAARGMLVPGGTLIVADERTGESFTAPADQTERMFYGFSVLTCLPSARNETPSAATGTVMRRVTFERYAAEAGFPAVEVLPIDHDFLRFYRLDVPPTA
jgi:2-polyprenyl-3-methyl-5-hydroxy-6-metoxy-1,4-benzoquinol methylase